MLPGKVPELERSVFFLFFVFFFRMTRPHGVENRYNLGLQLLSRKFCSSEETSADTQASCMPTTGLDTVADYIAFFLIFPIFHHQKGGQLRL